MLPSVLAAACVGVTIKLVSPQSQALIPATKYNGPCCSGMGCTAEKWSTCTGGLPGINAVYRDEENGADAVIKLGLFLQSTEQLVDEHPQDLRINEIVWRHVNASALLVYAPYVYTSTLDASVSAAVYLLDDGILRVLATNLGDTYSPLRGVFRPYEILEAAGVRVGLLSLYTRDFWAGAVPIVPYVRSVVKMLRRMHVDCVVAFIQYDRNYDPDEHDELVSTGIDVVMWGHQWYGNGDMGWTHKVNATTYNTTVDGESRTRWLFQHENTDEIQGIRCATMEFTDGANPRLIKASLRMRFSTEYEGDARDEIYHRDEDFIARLIAESSEVDQVLGFSTAPMPHGYIRDSTGVIDGSCRHEECHLGAWASDEVRRFRSTTDIALINSGGLRSGWDEGNITRSELNKAVPYKNTLCYVKMTAANIWRELEHSVAVITSEGQFNSSGEITGRFLQVSGLRYRINPRNPIGERITAIETPVRDANGAIIGWGPIDAFRTYEVVTLSYVCSGGDQFSMPPVSGTMREITDINWWGLLADSLKTGPLTPYVRDYIRLDFAGTPITRFVTRASDCPRTARYDPFYEACEPCPPGFYHPHAEAQECVLEPIPTDVMAYVGPSVGGTVVLIIAAAVIRYWHQRMRLEALNKFAPKQAGKPVSLIFTDIQKSADLWGKMGDAMGEALRTHHEICRRLLATHAGYEVKTIGDAFFCAFESAPRAVEFAMALQVELMAATWPKELESHAATRPEVDNDDRPMFTGLRVRVGVHTGVVNITVTPQGGYDYEGPEVNIAARVGDSGNGGQVLITQATYDAVLDDLDDMFCDCEVQYLGQYKFRGVDDPLHIHSILPESICMRHAVFPEIRGGTLVYSKAHTQLCKSQPEGNDILLCHEDSTSASSSMLRGDHSSHRQTMVAVQRVRRWVGRYGAAGIPIPTLSSAITEACDIGAAEVAFLNSVLSLLVAIQAGKTEIRGRSWRAAGGGVRPPSASTDEQQRGAGDRLRWPAVSRLLSSIPESHVVALGDELGEQPAVRGSNSTRQLLDSDGDGSSSSTAEMPKRVLNPLTARRMLPAQALPPEDKATQGAQPIPPPQPPAHTEDMEIYEVS